ncbi:peptide chain release factor eRF1/aRF1 [Auriculariales sp. MPI-PUGE-AT-0066]|nr:peptide chain release factor eRF1/aRF1 [Auriculariales sp. MPI-PUGE-AT-0066]
MSTAAVDANVEIWKLKRLIKSLDEAHGAGTSMISLILPPKSQIQRATTMLDQELGMAANIKSHVNKLSVQNAIRSTLTRLKLYNQTPQNGLGIFVGTISTADGKTKRVALDFEPPKPFSQFVYFCGSKFATEELAKLMNADDSRFGFIIVDGGGVLLGAVSGSTRTVLHHLRVDLPKKHSRGGQSAARFSRLRDEARHNYVRKVAELAVAHFIDNQGEKANITGLVLAGSADFKNELAQSELLDARLASKIVRVVDISYGGMSGFNQAIELAADALASVKFIQEKRLIQTLFDEISRDSSKYTIGVADTMRALEIGAVDRLLLWDNLDVVRHVLSDGDVQFARPGQLVEGTSGDDEPQNLLEWLTEHYAQYGASLEFVTDTTPEGAQFVRGFGGIAALLRYAVDPTLLSGEAGVDENEDEFYSDEENDRDT